MAMAMAMAMAIARWPTNEMERYSGRDMTMMMPNAVGFVVVVDPRSLSAVSGPSHRY